MRQRGFEVARGYEDKDIHIPVRKTKNSAGYDGAEKCCAASRQPRGHVLRYDQQPAQKSERRRENRGGSGKICMARMRRRTVHMGCLLCASQRSKEKPAPLPQNVRIM